jgi:hypothetical protein
VANELLEEVEEFIDVLRGVETGLDIEEVLVAGEDVVVLLEDFRVLEKKILEFFSLLFE